MAAVRYMRKREAELYKLWMYPNFGPNGSVAGMRKLFLNKNDMLVRSGSYVYIVPQRIYDAAH